MQLVLVEERSMSRIEKPYGLVEVLCNGAYSCTKLTMIKGRSTGYQAHTIRDKHIYLYSGKLQVELYTDMEKQDRLYSMEAGDSLRIDAGQIHRLTALADCVLFEISVTIRDNDTMYFTRELERVVRMYDD
jgi:mannose-6-phosphate isomerase-like protein (cupin superfamily)